MEFTINILGGLLLGPSLVVFFFTLRWWPIHWKGENDTIDSMAEFMKYYATSCIKINFVDSWRRNSEGKKWMRGKKGENDLPALPQEIRPSQGLLLILSESMSWLYLRNFFFLLVVYFLQSCPSWSFITVCYFNHLSNVVQYQNVFLITPFINLMKSNLLFYLHLWHDMGTQVINI